jgi:small-conductance mechanosensitive channel
MIRIAQEIFEKAMARLSLHLVTFVPPLIVAVVILLVTFVVALALRWLILKAIKGAAIDKFLRDSGMTSGRSTNLRAATLVAGLVYWTTLGVGLLTALDVFDTSLTTRIIESVVFAIPKLLTAAAILLAAYWLSRYLSRSALVWAVNDELPYARRLALGVKLGILFVAVVVASETLGFAERVFFAAFVIVGGACGVAVAIAAGTTLRSLLSRSSDRKGEPAERELERSLWSHL